MRRLEAAVSSLSKPFLALLLLLGCQYSLLLFLLNFFHLGALNLRSRGYLSMAGDRLCDSRTQWQIHLVGRI